MGRADTGTVTIMAGQMDIQEASSARVGGRERAGNTNTKHIRVCSASGTLCSSSSTGKRCKIENRSPVYAPRKKSIGLSIKTVPKLTPEQLAACEGWRARLCAIRPGR